MKIQAAYRLKASGYDTLLGKLGLAGTLVKLSESSSTFELDEDDEEDVIETISDRFGKAKTGASASQRIYVWEPKLNIGLALYVGKLSRTMTLEIYTR